MERNFRFIFPIILIFDIMKLIIVLAMVFVICLLIKETKCPYCGGDSIASYDFKENKVIWRCLRCKRRWGEMTKTALVLLPTTWTGEKPIIKNSEDVDLKNLINQGYRIKIMNDFEYNGSIYTEKWQDRCHPLGWLCELPHHP